MAYSPGVARPVSALFTGVEYGALSKVEVAQDE